MFSLNKSPRRRNKIHPTCTPPSPDDLGTTTIPREEEYDHPYVLWSTSTHIPDETRPLSHPKEEVSAEKRKLRYHSYIYHRLSSAYQASSLKGRQRERIQHKPRRITSSKNKETLKVQPKKTRTALKEALQAKVRSRTSSHPRLASRTK